MVKIYWVHSANNAKWVDDFSEDWRGLDYQTIYKLEEGDLENEITFKIRSAPSILSIESIGRGS